MSLITASQLVKANLCESERSVEGHVSGDKNPQALSRSLQVAPRLEVAEGCAAVATRRWTNPQRQDMSARHQFVSLWFFVGCLEVVVTTGPTYCRKSTLPFPTLGRTSEKSSLCSERMISTSRLQGAPSGLRCRLSQRWSE